MSKKFDLADAVYAGDAVSINPEEEPENQPQETEETFDEELTHPAVFAIDTAFHASQSFLKNKKLPQPDSGAYEGLARPQLNAALNQIFPAENEKEPSPVMALLIGILGLALAFAPVILYFIDKKLTEQKQQQIQQPRPAPQQEPQQAPQPEAVPAPIQTVQRPAPQEAMLPNPESYKAADSAGHWMERIAQFEP